MATSRVANLTASKTFSIDTPMAQWKITHNFGYNPVVQTVVNDGDGTQNVWLAKNVSFPDVNTIIIDWSEPRSGEVRLS